MRALDIFIHSKEVLSQWTVCAQVPHEASEHQSLAVTAAPLPKAVQVPPWGSLYVSQHWYLTCTGFSIWIRILMIFLCQAAYPDWFDFRLNQVTETATGPRMVAENICEILLELPSLRATSPERPWTAGDCVDHLHKQVSPSLPETNTSAGLSVLSCFHWFFYYVHIPILSLGRSYHSLFDN